jgi:hypothetical protein
VTDTPAELDEVLQEVQEAGQHPSEELLDRARALGPAAIPRLIEMATDEALHFAGEDSPAVWAPLHAVRLLGELQAAVAVEPLLPLLSWDDDWLGEELPVALGRIGMPSMAPLRDMLFDPSGDVFVRGRAGTGLAKIAEYHPDRREEIVALLTAFLDDRETSAPDRETLNGFVISDLVELNAKEALPAIQRAFEADRVDTMITGLADVERDLSRPDDISLHEWWRQNPLYPMVPGFTGELRPQPAPVPQPHIASQLAPALPRAHRKVGRNDPCPCGSGKKYKRCCGR